MHLPGLIIPNTCTVLITQCRCTVPHTTPGPSLDLPRPSFLSVIFPSLIPVFDLWIVYCCWPFSVCPDPGLFTGLWFSACRDPFLVSGLSLPCLCCPVCCCWSMPVRLLYKSCIWIPLCLLNHYNTYLDGHNFQSTVDNKKEEKKETIQICSQLK